MAAVAPSCDGKAKVRLSIRRVYYLLMHSGERIRLALLKELASAHREFDASFKDFGRIVKELRAGSGSDGSLALRLASHHSRRAFGALQKATEQYNSFVLDGIVPDGMREPGEQTVDGR
jgi:hypothetical protein